MSIFQTEKTESLKSRLFRFSLNLIPAYRGTGARCIFLSDDLHEVHIKLPLNLRTRNYVGTIFGGSMYGAVDPIYMVQLINILGKDYVVWDKAASVRFRKPGNNTLYARFIISDDLLEDIKTKVIREKEIEIELTVNLVDKNAHVYAEIAKNIYIADKKFYQNKRKLREADKK